MKKIFTTLSVLIMGVLICLNAVGCTFFDSTASVKSKDIITNESAIISAQSVELKTIDSQERIQYSLEDAVEKVDRTSVAIEITTASGSTGAGSGVILDVGNSDNYIYIITCHHVIGNTGSIKVKIPDNNCEYSNNDYIFEGVIGNQIYTDNAVTLVGGDRVSDIAIIKIDLSKPAVSGKVLAQSAIQKAKVPADTYSVRKGERVFAIGNPSGELPGSVSEGIVSYLDRETAVDEVGNMHLMQISVTTNPGNSGGGLYNLYGELIGITNAGNTSYEAINFAIPYVLSNGNGYLSIAKQLIGSATATNYGYVDNRWELGISVKQYGNFSSYLEITSVVANSNASLSGLQTGDILNSIIIDGLTYSIDNSSYFAYYMGYARSVLTVGDSFGINVSRKISGTSNRYQAMTININITVANYIFCNTGN